MWSVLLTRVLASCLLVLWTNVQYGTAQQSAEGCDCQLMSQEMAQMQTTFSEQIKQSQVTDNQQSDKLFMLSMKVKKNSASVDQLSEQVNNLTAHMDSSNNTESMEKEVKILESRIQEVDFKGTMLKKRVDKLFEQFDQMSERLDRAESQLEEAPEALPHDCSELPAGSQSGLYLLQPATDGRLPVQAFCDLENDGGGWTVIQQRDSSRTREKFRRSWADYSRGFGHPLGEFWWGLENMWTTTSTTDRQYELRIDLENAAGQTRHATYQNFQVSSAADGYRLTVGDCAGDAGDSLGGLSGQRFSTRDKDQDDVRRFNCALQQRSGWWFKDCGPSNLNGATGGRRYGRGGAKWGTFNQKYPLTAVSMKIRPTN